MKYTDQLKRSLELHQPPQRIVSLVPSQTELLYDLGLGTRVVGRTRFCIHPHDAVQAVPIVGGTKDFKPEKIYQLKPDLVLANKEENSKEPLLSLAETLPVWVSDVPHLTAALDMIRQIGTLTGAGSTAKALISELETGFAQLSPLFPHPKTLYLIWREPYMSIGGDTFIHDMLTRLGLNNICGGHRRYPEITPAVLQRLQPELILLSSEPYPFKTKHMAELEALCPQARILLVDGEAFSWYGSRLMPALAYFRTLLDDIRDAI